MITGRIQKLFKSGRPLKAVRENVPLFLVAPFKPLLSFSYPVPALHNSRVAKTENGVLLGRIVLALHSNRVTVQGAVQRYSARRSAKVWCNDTAHGTTHGEVQMYVCDRPKDCEILLVVAILVMAILVLAREKQNLS